MTAIGFAHANEKWTQYYSIVNKDIAKIEALKSKDLSLQIRLFELYGEKLSLLLEKENEYKIKYLATGKSKKLNQVMSLQKNSLLKLEIIARNIERQTTKLSVLTKINYYRALNYYLVKDYKRFYTHIKKAEKTNKDSKLEYLINSKLADHHYNEGEFQRASFYYKKILGNKSNGWLTKIYYNLAWCELKQKRYSTALSSVKMAYSFEQKKGYFKVGEQLIDAILLFHAISRKTDEGLDYLSQQKISNFQNLIKYLHYVFENGNRSKISKIISSLDRLEKNSDQQLQLLEKKIVVYRPLKKFSLIQGEFQAFENRFPKIKLNKIKEETRSDLKNAIVSYTGYLQELVKSKRLISEKSKRKYVSYIASNFGIMKLIDPKSSMEYNYYEGETYFSLGDFSKASKVYVDGIKKYQQSDKKNKEYTAKTYESLFKAIEKQNKPDERLLLFSLQSYLKSFPRGLKSKLVHQRLVNFYQSKGETKKVLAALRSYNRNYPSDINLQRDYYKTLLNESIDKKDINSLNSLKNLIDKGFLKFPKEESAKIGLVITQLYFSKYDNLEKQGKNLEALKGFDSIYKDKKNDYKLRVEALRKKLFLLNKEKLLVELGDEIVSAAKFYNVKMKKTYGAELVIYAEGICSGDELLKCTQSASALIKDPKIKTSKALKNFYFKITSAQSGNYEEAYAMANSSAKKNYLFKIIVEESPNFRIPLFVKYYALPQYKSIIDAEIERKFLNSFYHTLSFKSFERFLIRTPFKKLKNSYELRISKIKNSISMSRFSFTKVPTAEKISAEQFGTFGGQFNLDLTKIINKINSGLVSIDPNFAPYYLSNVIKNFRIQSESFKKFAPASDDSQLESAMNDEMAKLHQFLDQKLLEYQQLYFESIKRTANLSGAKKYSRGIIDSPMKNDLEGLGLWQN